MWKIIIIAAIAVVAFGIVWSRSESTAGFVYDACSVAVHGDGKQTIDAQRCLALAKHIWVTDGYSSAVAREQGIGGQTVHQTLLEEDDEQLRPLKTACPYLEWTSFDPGYLFVQYWDDEGMGWYRFTPADFAIRIAYRSLYPGCPSQLKAMQSYIALRPQRERAKEIAACRRGETGWENVPAYDVIAHLSRFNQHCETLGVKTQCILIWHGKPATQEWVWSLDESHVECH